MLEQIKATFDAFYADATKANEKGNHSAGVRARKSSLEIDKLLKAFRKESVTWGK